MSIIGSLPYTLANGQTADATKVMADFNKIISDVNANARSNVFQGATVYNSSTQNANSLSQVTVVYDTAAIDSNSFYSDSHTSRLTIPDTGVSVVRLTGQVEFHVSGSGFAEGDNLTLGILMNGSAVTPPIAVGTLTPALSGNTGEVLQISTPPISVSGSDYFTMVAYNGSGGTAVLGNSAHSWFSIEVLG